MALILVTGGTGQLGRAIVAQLAETPHVARVMSRRAAPERQRQGQEWARADLATGEGLAEALDGVYVVAHCASNPAGDTHQSDVLGTKQLLQQARRSGVEHFLYISIVGVERIPYTYYQHKLATELAVVESGVPYSIARVTQFHEFVDFILQPLLSVDESPLRVPHDVLFQSIATQDVAALLLPYLTAGPSARLSEMAGPAVMTLEEMAHGWLEARGRKQSLATVGDAGHLSLAPELIAGFRQGYNTAPDNARGQITWAEFVQRRAWEKR